MSINNIEHTTLGSSDIRVSKICLGTWAIGGWMWGGTEEEESIRTIHAALDRGITFIDTAPVYGFGRSEEIVGKALPGDVAREGVVMATKVGLEWTEQDKVRRNRPASASSKRWTIPCAACRPTTSTSTRSTGRTPRCPSRRPPRPWPSCWRPARSARSG